MGAKLADMLKASYDKGYNAAYQDAGTIAMKTAHMAFCIAMNKKMQVGSDRLNKIEDLAMTYIAIEFTKEPELTFSRLSREYERIMGRSIEERYTRK